MSMRAAMGVHITELLNTLIGCKGVTISELEFMF